MWKKDLLKFSTLCEKQQLLVFKTLLSEKLSKCSVHDCVPHTAPILDKYTQNKHD